MLKRLFLSLGLCLGLTAQALAYGTIPGISMAQQLGTTGAPLSGGKVYLIQAGTTSTPQNCYQDAALSIAWPNPITLDSTGRVPQLFCADGSIKVRITDANGVQQFVGDNILVVGASGGGGGGSSVDATTILTTGDIKAVYGTGVVTGFVRLNGRTIGSATSGATERANSDTNALFLYLWGADANLAVSTGRGASAAADWAANKTIALPDFRSRALAGLGDMGNSDNALLSGVTFTSGNSTTLGSLVGAARRTLATGNLPPYTPAGTIANGAFSTNTNISSIVNGGNLAFSTSNAGVSGGNLQSILGIAQAASIFTGSAQGGTSTPFDIVSPRGLVTIYVKL